jgi:hypothetical protein
VGVISIRFPSFRDAVWLVCWLTGENPTPPRAFQPTLSKSWRNLLPIVVNPIVVKSTPIFGGLGSFIQERLCRKPGDNGCV